MTPEHTELLQQAIQQKARRIRRWTVALFFGLFINVFIGMSYGFFWIALSGLTSFGLGLHLGGGYGFIKGLTAQVIVNECEEPQEEE